MKMYMTIIIAFYALLLQGQSTIPRIVHGNLNQ